MIPDLICLRECVLSAEGQPGKDNKGEIDQKDLLQSTGSQLSRRSNEETRVGACDCLVAIFRHGAVPLRSPWVALGQHRRCSLDLRTAHCILDLVRGREVSVGARKVSLGVWLEQTIVPSKIARRPIQTTEVVY
jgi:hypothetical protein